MITDKSVDTFEQNKRFLLASFRNWKKTNIFFVDSQTPSPPFQCWNALCGRCHVVTTLKRREGVKMWKLEIEKLTHSTKQGFFRGVSQLLLSMIAVIQINWKNLLQSKIEQVFWERRAEVQGWKWIYRTGFKKSDLSFQWNFETFQSYIFRFSWYFFPFTTFEWFRVSIAKQSNRFIASSWSYYISAGTPHT